MRLAPLGCKGRRLSPVNVGNHQGWGQAGLVARPHPWRKETCSASSLPRLVFPQCQACVEAPQTAGWSWSSLVALPNPRSSPSERAEDHCGASETGGSGFSSLPPQHPPLPKPLLYQVALILPVKISGTFSFSPLPLTYYRWALSGLPGSCPLSASSTWLPQGFSQKLVLATMQDSLGLPIVSRIKSCPAIPTLLSRLPSDYVYRPISCGPPAAF